MKTKMFFVMLAATVVLVLLTSFGGYYFMNQGLADLTAESFRSTYLMVAGAMALFLCITLSIASFLVIHLMTKPIQKLSESTEELSSGQLAMKAYDKGMTGKVGSNINKIVKNLKTIICEINKISEQNKSLADTLHRSVVQTDKASNEIAHAITDVAGNTSNQAKSIIKAKSSTEVMTDNSMEIAKRATDTKNIAKQMTEVIQNSGVVFNKLTEKLKNTAEVSVGIADRVEALHNEADKIKNIVTTVTEISERTNLLALNAAIEAARAGEHGKGFAVVSDEVRKLAEQSALASEEIKHLIVNIIQSINDITNKTKEEVTKINEDIQFADQSKHTFDEVAETTQHTYDSIQHIFVLAEQSADVVKTVSSLMDEVAASVEETVAFTEEVSASAEEQSAAMQETAELIGNMRDMANHIDTKLYEFISKIKISEKQQMLVQEGLKALQDIAQHLRSNPMTMENASVYLQGQQKKYKQFEFVGIFNDKGRLVTGTDMSVVDDTDYSYRPYYIEAIKGAEFKSEPYISTYSYNYCISISIPYKDGANRIIGVAVADICIED